MTLVHLRIMVLDVAVNTDTSIAVDTNEISEIINVAQLESLEMCKHEEGFASFIITNDNKTLQ